MVNRGIMRMTKFALVGAVALSFVSACTASAADLPPRPAPPVVRAPVIVEPIFTWTGCYIGGNGGGGSMNKGFRSDSFAPNQDFGSHSGTGGVAGGQIGCDYQFGGGFV